MAPAARMVGRVPLIPLFLAGNSTATIPHQYSQHKRLWQFGRGKPRLGGLSVEKTDDRKAAAQKERLLRGAETQARWRRKADRA